MSQKISLMANRPDNSGYTFREVVVGGVVGNYKVKDWLTATEAPNVNYDTLNGWSKGSIVYYDGVIYICEDPTTAAAVWKIFNESTSGISTITPAITVGTGTCTDVTISFIRVGDRVHFQFHTRTFTIPIGESALTITVDLTGTGFEPSTDFAGTGDVFGICRPANVIDGANELSGAIVESDLPKKIKITVQLTANASGSDFSSAVTGSGSYSIS